MKYACAPLLLSLAIVFGTGCVPEGVKKAREFTASGNLYQACMAFEAELKALPEDADLQAEFNVVRDQFVKHTLDKENKSPIEHIELAVRYLKESEAPKWKRREGLKSLYESAKAASAWTKMVDAALAMEDFGKAAHVYKDHPELDGATDELKKLATAHPKDQSVCGAHAGYLGETRDYDAAIKEYERCQLIEGGSIERSVYFGAQMATLKKYQEVEKGKGKKTAKKRRKGRKRK